MAITTNVPSNNFEDLKRDVEDATKWVNGTEPFQNRVGESVKPIPLIQQEWDQTATGQFVQQTQSLVSQAQGFASQAETSAEVASATGRIYETSAAGQADVGLATDDYFWVISLSDMNVLELWRKGASAPVSLGKTTISSSVANVFSQQRRIFEFPSNTKFDASSIQGSYGPDMATISNLTFNIDANNEINVTAGMSDNFARLFTTGIRRQAGQPLTAKLTMSFANTALSCRAIIAIGQRGNPDSLTQYIATSTRALSLQTGSNNNTVFAYSNTAILPNNLLNDEKITLTISVDKDGNGFMYAEKENGGFCCKIENLPAGDIFFGARTTSAWKVHDFNAELVGPSEQKADPNATALNETNLLPSDLTKGESIVSGSAVFNEWRTQTNAPQILNLGGVKGVLFSNDALRTIIPVPVGVHQKASYSVDIKGVFAGSGVTGDRFSLVQRDINNAELTRKEVFLLGRDPSKVIEGVIDLDPLCSNIIFFVGTTTLAREVIVTKASLVFGDTVGFRPYKEPQQGQGTVDEQLTFLSYTLLPDSVPNRDPKGFTCTGLDRITRGNYAGCWLVGDDGRIRDTSFSNYAPAVHVMTPDFRVILQTFEMGYDNSLQGVAVDTSGANDTFWIATAGDRQIRHYELYGENAGVEIVGDRFDWTAAGYGSNPNGLAYDPVNDALWATPISGNQARLLSCDSSVSPRLLNEVTIFNNGPDQLHYDSQRSLLYYSLGSNGVNGAVRCINVSTNVEIVAYEQLKHCQAIEGIYIDRATKRLTVVSDGGYHVAARPQLNIALEYSIPLID